MKSYQGQTGAADPVRLFSIVCGDEYFSVGTKNGFISGGFGADSSDFAIISHNARDRDHRAPMLSSCR
jgi:hypothetical protein